MVYIHLLVNVYKYTHRTYLYTFCKQKVNKPCENLNSNNKKLKLRIKVENVINSIKKFNRIKIRKDRNIKYYLSWVYLSCLINNINVNI